MKQKTNKMLIFTSLAAYFTYFIHGIGASILGQYKPEFAAAWGAKTLADGTLDVSMVVSVIAALGLGRLISLPFSGPLSDKYGRRLSGIIGVLCYVAYFFGMANSTSMAMGYAFAVIGGIANSFLDTCVSPTCMEIYVNNPSVANLFTKFSICLSQFLLPFLIGIVASIYVMANKEYLSSRGKKIVYALFKLKNANIILDGLASVNKIFSQFINGKIVDSIIIGIITFILTTIVDMPYALLISVIIGVTNVIPFFGPIIGAIPCVFIVLIADPIKSIILLIMILCIQQFDGNILGPKILGDVTGLSSFWVLTAVIVGGGIFGFYGMLLGVPVFACIYMYINKTCTDKLEKKHMVSVSSEFERIKRIDEETGKPIYLTEEEEDIRFHKKTPEEKAAAKAEREAKRHAKKLYQQIEKVMHAEKADDQLAATKHEAEKQSSDDDKDDQM